MYLRGHPAPAAPGCMMYRKLTEKMGVRMPPHRFRHTPATNLMRQPERNIHLTKSLLNHSNIATTRAYIETDYGYMRAVLHERSLTQGALALERRVDEQRPVAALVELPAPAAEISPLKNAQQHLNPRYLRSRRSRGSSASQQRYRCRHYHSNLRRHQSF